MRLRLVISALMMTATIAGCAAAPDSDAPATSTSVTSTTTEVQAAVNPIPALDIEPGSIGDDTSFPQCGEALPEPRGFVVVGVNMYLPTELNPCFDDQIARASQADHPPLLYVNAANPAGLNTATWPTSGGNNEYGRCTGADDAACSYQYGKDRIAADNDLINRLQRRTIVFIAVEREFSWEDGTQTPETRLATLKGMADAIREGGNQPGIYATGADWRLLMGEDVKPGTSLHGTPIWWRGGTDLDEAKANCLKPSFTGGKIVLSQVPAENVGSDISESVAC